MAVYTNQDMGSGDLGHKQFLSFGGSAEASFGGEPPVRLPDFPQQINWRYRLFGTYRGETL